MARVQSEKDRSLNQVKLRGRISGEKREKVFPSGDSVLEFRLVVKRDDDGYDTLDIAAWKAAIRKRALALADQEWVEVTGVIRRRFWNSPGGLSSRWQVEARELVRL
jgi:single-strand DNA-binding protein